MCVRLCWLELQQPLCNHEVHAYTGKPICLGSSGPRQNEPAGSQTSIELLTAPVLVPADGLCEMLKELYYLSHCWFDEWISNDRPQTLENCKSVQEEKGCRR